MLIVNKIDQLIEKLNDLRPEISADEVGNKKKFTELLQGSLQLEAPGEKNSPEINDTLLQQESLKNASADLDPNYSNISSGLQKPNMKELMELLSGREIEDLYADPTSDWVNLSIQASEILYGVVGSRVDTRNWSKIISSDDLLNEARAQTNEMYRPVVDIETTYDKNENIRSQSAVIKDQDGTILRHLSTNLDQAEFSLLNFGAEKSSIPTNLEEMIVVDDFDQNLINFLKSYEGSTANIAKTALRTATEVISNQIELSIPAEEFEKL